MSRLREARQRLGKSGIAFLITLAFFVLFYFTNHGLLAALCVLTLIPLAAILTFRFLRHLTRYSLWSLRNRLLFVYGLIGVLPILLLFLLIGLAIWALTSELAIYLARSALDHRLDSIRASVADVEKIPPGERERVVPEVEQALMPTFPRVIFYIRDQTGDHRYPASSPPLAIPPGWKNVDGLLLIQGEFYAWAHFADPDDEITAIAPLSQEMIADLVPHLGVVTLFPTSPEKGTKWRNPESESGSNTDIDEKVLEPRLAHSQHHLPPPMSRLDVPVAYPSFVPHYELDSPNQTYRGVLLVESRPSAVLSTFFSGTELLRGVLLNVVIAVAILFLFVELVAAIIGVSLARRITRAVNQLYEGTRRVIHGDFTHRIPVRTADQLGELSQSFNQMTGNLERLLAVEKEKERLQTEIEIAREVQAQLYPKGLPPDCGLKLSVRCDPARMVSGDYYDYQLLPGNKLAFVIGDVAGKGISAALLMATLQAALKAQLSKQQPMRENECTHSPEIDAAAVVSQLNQQIYAHTSPEKYATFFFAVFDEKTRTLTYSNAGHLSPLLFRNGDVRRLESNGIVIGAFPFAKYDENCLTMQPGDLLVCYTDGITEPENAYGEMFGEERLIELIAKHAHEDGDEIVRIVLEAVRSWTATPELFDDMTLLLAREVQAA